MPSAPNAGSFVPSTSIWDVSDVNRVKDLSPELRELLVRMYQNLNLMSVVLNLKDSGYYVTTEFVNGQQFFPNPTVSTTRKSPPAFRQDYRMTVNFGALPNSTTKSVPHNIPVTSATIFTRIYGAATNPSAPEGIPIPYASSTVANIIELYVDATNVNITTAANYSAYTITYVVIEYLKN